MGHWNKNTRLLERPYVRMIQSFLLRNTKPPNSTTTQNKWDHTNTRPTLTQVHLDRYTYHLTIPSHWGMTLPQYASPYGNKYCAEWRFERSLLGYLTPGDFGYEWVGQILAQLLCPISLKVSFIVSSCPSLMCVHNHTSTSFSLAASEQLLWPCLHGHRLMWQAWTNSWGLYCYWAWTDHMPMTAAHWKKVPMHIDEDSCHWKLVVVCLLLDLVKRNEVPLPLFFDPAHPLLEGRSFWSISIILIYFDHFDHFDVFHQNRQTILIACRPFWSVSIQDWNCQNKASQASCTLSTWLHAHQPFVIPTPSWRFERLTPGDFSALWASGANPSPALMPHITSSIFPSIVMP